MAFVEPLDLFARARQIWPEEVLTDPAALNAIYWPIDETLRHDDWQSIAAWSFHQALFACAREARSRGHDRLATATVTFKDFDARVRSNLANESWDELRPHYGVA